VFKNGITKISYFSFAIKKIRLSLQTGNKKNIKFMENQTSGHPEFNIDPNHTKENEKNIDLLVISTNRIRATTN
jgi:hypothetical protein